VSTAVTQPLLQQQAAMQTFYLHRHQINFNIYTISNTGMQQHETEKFRANLQRPASDMHVSNDENELKGISVSQCDMSQHGYSSRLIPNKGNALYRKV